MEKVEGLCEDVLMLNNGNAVAQGKITELKEQYGNSSISVPYSDEAYDVLKKYKPIKRENSLIVNIVDGTASYKNVIIDLIKSPMPMNYLKYDQMSLNDLFIRLLGE